MFAAHQYAIDLVLLTGRFLLGGFFVLDRFRWFFDPEDTPDATKHARYFLNKARREHLREKIEQVTGLKSVWWSTLIACVEFFGGLGIIFGFLTPLAALGLLSVLTVASHGTFHDKVIVKQQPIDKIDVVSCYLWLVEPLYMWFAAVFLFVGPGQFALDNFFWGLL